MGTLYVSRDDYGANQVCIWTSKPVCDSDGEWHTRDDVACVAELHQKTLLMRALGIRSPKPGECVPYEVTAKRKGGK